MYKLIFALLSVTFLIASPVPSFANTETAGEYATASSITADVKAKLLAEPSIKSLKISVKTVDGKVTLTGDVENAQQKDTAGSIASQVKGVSSVENNLTVKSP